MSGIEKRIGTYDENLTDIRNLKPLTVALTAILAVWSIVYLLGPHNSKLERADGPFTG